MINATVTKNRQVEKAGIAKKKNWKIVYKLPSKIRYKMTYKKKQKTDEENMAKVVNQAYEMDGNASKNLLKRFLLTPEKM